MTRETKVGLLTKLKAALESDGRVKPEMIADLQGVIGTNQETIAGLKRILSENCQTQ